LWHASLGLASQHPRIGGLREPIERPSVGAAASGGGAGCARPPVPLREAEGAALAAAARCVSGAARPAGPSAPESCSVGGGDAAVLALPDVFGDTRPLQSAHVRAQLARRNCLSKDDVAGAADAVSARVYGSSKYRSPTPREATYAVLSARNPVTQVVVLPTGGGKTSTFLVPALCESLAAVAAARDDAHGSACVSHIGAAPATEHGGARGGGLCVSDAPAAWYPPVTIVLKPTRAVTANTVEAATAAGLTVGEWPRGCDAGDASLFVMDTCMIVQHAAVFLELVRRLSLAGRLARIVIDEVHLVLLWSTFRDALAHVRAVLADLPCPLLLLTATLPRRWLNAGLAGVGFTSSRPWCFIRPPSTRREIIRYLVEAVPDGVRFYRNPAASVVGNRPLHAAVASRVLQQAGLMRSATADRHGQSVVMGVCCETVAEVDGIAAELAACLRGSGWGGGRHGVCSTSLHPTELDDVAILKFHSQGATADGSSVPNCTSDSDTSRKEEVQTPEIGSVFYGHAMAASQMLERGLTTPMAVAVGADEAAEPTDGRGDGVGETRRPHRRPILSVSAVVAEMLAKPRVGIVIVVGSPAVSTGTDFAQMVWALFLGPRHLLGFVQASGRLSRISSAVASAVVWSPVGYTVALHATTSPAPAIDAVGDAVAWAVLPGRVCRRLGLDEKFDGVPRERFVSCIQGSFAHCDVCTQRTAPFLTETGDTPPPPSGKRRRDDGASGNDEGGDMGGGGGQLARSPSRTGHNNGATPPRCTPFGVPPRKKRHKTVAGNEDDGVSRAASSSLSDPSVSSPSSPLTTLILPARPMPTETAAARGTPQAQATSSAGDHTLSDFSPPRPCRPLSTMPFPAFCGDRAIVYGQLI